MICGNIPQRSAQTKSIIIERSTAMNEPKELPPPVDPIDGTKVYKPLDKRFSVGEELGGVSFDDLRNLDASAE